MKKEFFAMLAAVSLLYGNSSAQIGQLQPPQTSQISLKEKAEFFEEDLFTYHLTPEGLLAYNIRMPQIANNPKLNEYGDAAIWTGVLLGAESFRYSVTKDEDALKNIEKMVGGLHNLQEVTGVEGLLARFYGKKSDLDLENFVRRESFHKIYEGKGKFEGYLSVGDTSNDQYMGVFFGYYICYNLVENEEIKKVIRQDVNALANHIVDNGIRITGSDGKPTTYGDMSPKGMDEKLDALLALSMLKIAHHITNEEKFSQAYQELIKKYGYHKKAVKAKFAPLKMFDSGVNDNLAFLAYYPLLSLEADPELLKYYQKSMDRTFKWVKGEGNSFFNFIYNAVSSTPNYEENVEAAESLKIMPLEKKHITIINSNRKSLCTKKVLNRHFKFELRACDALPMDERPSGPEFVWRGNPRKLDSYGNGEVKYSGLDFLIAYWMGRYHKFVE
ncbi:hypothetical protein HY643_04375 [Candidatus Woesearchaeota archaeon]|nr:hypothetical protein [Candidatus Woesearchaeota archaeon]